MRFILTLLVCILLLSTVVSAHTLERKEIIRSDETYNVKFTTEPEYPLTGRAIHLDFVIWDNDGNILPDLDVKIELRKNGQTIVLQAEITEEHYEIEYKAEEFGVYTLSPIINNEKVDIQFDIYVDTFGIKGFSMVGILFILALILLFLMYKDCKRKKRRGKRR